MKWLVLSVFFVAFIGCRVVPASSQSNEVIGVVQKIDGTHISNITVYLFEDADRSWTVVPKADQKVGSAQTSSRGDFRIELPPKVKASSLRLIAIGGADGTKSVALKPIILNEKNILVVPNNFVPAPAR